LENPISIVMAILWMLSVFLSIYHCFRCFRPQIELKYQKNVFFFMDAVYAFGEAEDYAKKLIDVCTDEQQLYTQLGEQIHAECKIIDQKFKSVQMAIRYFALSFVFVIISNAIWVIKIYL